MTIFRKQCVDIMSDIMLSYAEEKILCATIRTIRTIQILISTGVPISMATIVYDVENIWCCYFVDEIQLLQQITDN